MPQMSPLLWMILYMYFLILFFFIMFNLNYFLLVNKEIKEVEMKKEKKNFNLQW